MPLSPLGVPLITKVSVFSAIPPPPPPAPPEINVASSLFTMAGTVNVFVLPASLYSVKPAVGAPPPPPPAPITVTLITPVYSGGTVYVPSQYWLPSASVFKLSSGHSVEPNIISFFVVVSFGLNVPLILTFSFAFFVITGANAASNNEATNNAISISTNEKAGLDLEDFKSCTGLSSGNA